MIAMTVAERFRDQIRTKEHEVQALLAQLREQFDDPVDLGIPRMAEARRRIDETSSLMDDITRRARERLDALTHLARFLIGTADELREAQRLLVSLSGDVEARRHAVTDDVWSGSAASGYRDTVGSLAHRVDATATELSGLDEAAFELGTATLEYVVALAQLQLDRLDQWIGILARAVEDTGLGVEHWTGQLTGNVRSYAIVSQEAFDDVVERLEQFTDDHRILERASNLC